jgi:sugar-specific transcriptional regulator TrmB
MSKIIKNALVELECSPFEITIYELLLNQDMGITELASHFGVHREKIYLALEKMQQKGIVQKPEQFARKITIHSPSHILTLLKLKMSKTNHILQELNNGMPDILYLNSGKKKAKWADFIEGENDFLSSYDQFIKEAKTDISCYINPIIFNEIIDFSFVKHWSKIRQNKKLNIRILAPKEYDYLYKIDPELESKQKFLREIRYFEISQKFQGTIHVSGELVLLFDTVSLKAVLIKNYIIANTLAAMFETIWKSLEVKTPS